MKCTNCGYAVRPDTYCIHCGTKAPQKPTKAKKAAQTAPPATPYMVDDVRKAPQPPATPPMQAGEVANLAYDAQAMPGTVNKRGIKPIWVLVIAAGILLVSALATLLVLGFGSRAAKTDELPDQMVVKTTNGMYHVVGKDARLLTDKVQHLELFPAHEMLADGTMFVVHDLKKLPGRDTEVGELIMIAPNGDVTHIADDVYATVFSMFDNVCYYQVIEKDHEKICVVVDGVSHDVTGWVDGKIDYGDGLPDGSEAYFTIARGGKYYACYGKDGEYQELMQATDDMFWMVSNNRKGIYIVSKGDDDFDITGVTNGQPDGSIGRFSDVHFKYNTGELAGTTESGQLKLFANTGAKPIILAEGMDEDNFFVFAQDHVYATPVLIYDNDGMIYGVDLNDDAYDSIALTDGEHWTYALDHETNELYVTVDDQVMLILTNGLEDVKKVLMEDETIYSYSSANQPHAFYYVTGTKTDEYIDPEELYYYNGKTHILISQLDGDYGGVVMMMFDDTKLVWYEDEKLYMADPDGSNRLRVMHNVNWIYGVDDMLYVVKNNGNLLFVDKDGNVTEVLTDVTDVLPFDPKW